MLWFCLPPVLEGHGSTHGRSPGACGSLVQRMGFFHVLLVKRAKILPQHQRNHSRRAHEVAAPVYPHSASGDDQAYRLVEVPLQVLNQLLQKEISREGSSSSPKRLQHFPHLVPPDGIVSCCASLDRQCLAFAQ